jgi:hypothetical protein
MARRTVKIYGNGSPWITGFSFDEETLKDDKHDTLNVRRFGGPGNEWAFFVTNKGKYRGYSLFFLHDKIHKNVTLVYRVHKPQ